MQIRDDIPLPDMQAARVPWGTRTALFQQAKHGYSIHTADWQEAERIKVSFIAWKKRNSTDLKMTRRTVGRDDPDGEGWRFFFISK